MCHICVGGLHGKEQRVKALSECSKSVVNSVSLSRNLPVFLGFFEIIRVVVHTNKTTYTQLINTNIQMWELDVGSKITVTVYSNDLAFKLINIFKIQ